MAAARSLIQPIAPGLGRLDPVTLRVGDEHDFDDLLVRLVELAYTRVEMVTARGEFAVRGGIVDIFPPDGRAPVRVEFWGDEVSELRSFAVADQRSVAPVDVLHAPGCRELLLTAEVRDRAAALARAHENNPALRELLERLAEGIPVEGMESLIPALVGGAELELLTDLLPGRRAGAARRPGADPHPRRGPRPHRPGVPRGELVHRRRWAATPRSTSGASAYRGLDEVLEHAAATGRPVVTLSPLVSGAPTTTGPRAGRARGRVVPRRHGPGADRPARARRGRRRRRARRRRPRHRAARDRAAARRGRAGQARRAAVGGAGARPRHRHLRLPDATGCHRPTAAALVLLTEADLTGNRAPRPTDPRTLGSKRRRNAVDLVTLQPGDYVVHAQHGIGRFVEMRERTVSGATREYLVLEYALAQAGPARRTGCSCPTDALDEISRYVGGEVPTLNKLGGADWAKTKGRARKAVREIAAQLVQLYAARQSAPGHAFAPDTPWQRELEDAFPFTETPDQLSAIDEVKADMERPVPMDRVVSGDVGFGKTEIAVRAAFKAVQDGKQVAVLVPTTLLATQHLQTFSDRMRAFPVNVKGLSRFTDNAEAKQTIAGLADGTVDVVVGTHRLLQTGVRWKDLGLVIVDEEQRFGVEHKEHITALRAHVDMLTMSATPIPRTLEMSLAGIREMSTITTPPEDRHPMLTYVGAYDDKQVAAAIRRELLRDGQVFYVHNRVPTIERRRPASARARCPRRGSPSRTAR